jgi:predicted RNA-binding Zn-ribbon protein involved in translation (DUF1610 family)
MTQSHTSDLKSPPNASDHALGSAGAPITVTEYADFECPNCKQAAPVRVTGSEGRREGFDNLLFRLTGEVPMQTSAMPGGQDETIVNLADDLDCPVDVVERIYREEYSGLAESAHLQEYVSLFAERRTRQRIRRELP